MPPATAKISPTGVDPGPSAEPAQGDPLDRMMDRIGTKYAVDPATGKPVTKPKPDEPAKPAEPKEPVATEPKPGDDKLDDPAKADKADAKTEPTVTPDAKKEKVNPWKRGDEFKSLYEKSEAEVLRLKKLIPNEAELQQKQERFAQLEEQNKQLLEHIRYVDYQKHPEFVEKYEKPYQDAWGRLMRRLSGVGVAQEDGTRRAVEAADILKLSSLPADQVIEQAEAKFGKLGSFVAERVEDLKQLWENKMGALEKAKKDGSEFFQQQEQAFTAQQKELQEFLVQTWTKAVDEIKTHSRYGEYFNPIEGDDEWNAKLEDGTKKVAEALTGDPRDPSLTPEQRATIVKRHAAMRNRAAAFGVQNLKIQRLEAKLAEATEKLKQYETSTPKTEGSQPANGAPQPKDAWSSFDQRIEQYARR